MKRILYLKDDNKLAKLVMQYLRHDNLVDHVSTLNKIEDNLQ
jgi:two-component system OmpR family response regulator